MILDRPFGVMDHLLSNKEEFDRETIRLGMRKTVEWLRKNHCYPSSVGEVPFERVPLGCGPSCFIHIRVRHGDRVLQQARALAKKLQQQGVVYNVSDILTDEVWPVIRATYDPVQDIGAVTLIGIDDKALGLVDNIYVLPVARTG